MDMRKNDNSKLVEDNERLTDYSVTNKIKERYQLEKVGML